MIITVSSGEGLNSVFASLGAKILRQSMNPSVKEIIDAIEVPG